MALPERGETGSGDAVFTAEQLEQMTAAVREVMDRSGFGEVRIIIERRRVAWLDVTVRERVSVDRLA